MNIEMHSIRFINFERYSAEEIGSVEGKKFYDLFVLSSNVKCPKILTTYLIQILLILIETFQPTVLSIILITIGCLIASAGDLDFDAIGYLAGFTSVFAQAGYLTLVQRASAVEAALKIAESQVMLQIICTCIQYIL